MKDELGGQIMKEFVGLRANIGIYLKDNNDEDKKEKRHQKNVSQNLEAAQTENKINHLEKNKTDVDSLK